MPLRSWYLSFFFFGVLCFAATQLAHQLHQERTQMVSGTKYFRATMLVSGNEEANEVIYLFFSSNKISTA